ncbi:NADPH-dependent FMN reductase [Auraticoccus sp. F435]|uniref:NADPH-dependent FMN reductase n=1 Tax=Auraticoccus cholistanensis TaxID=2656650 RepID=A0A6A9UZF7_9ACTN|nr:CE1759 family FMN reductase [Auraticoccus cholistanensis]MVA77384.1 NADPH-dependent FMN reductase [Auraticoccus cholistanensis]
MTTRSLVVVSAGLSVPSSTRLLADRLTEAARRALSEAGDEVVVEVVELRELAHEMTDQLLTGVPGEQLERVHNSLAAADAVIAVTPVFAASYSGLFKTFVDLLPPQVLAGTPVLLGATAGSARHSLALDQAMRPLFGYLRALVVPTGVVAATGDFGSGSARGDFGSGSARGDFGSGSARVDVGSGADLAARVDRAGAELAALVRLPAPAPAAEPTAASPGLTPFEQLLAGRG